MEHFLAVLGATDRSQDIVPIDLPLGRAPFQKSEKNRNFRKLSRLAGSGGKSFRGFRPGREYVVGQPIA